MSKTPKYFMVRRDDGAPLATHEPRVKHATYEIAVEEAQRLAAKHPGVTFIVMHPVVGFQFAPPVPVSPFVKIEFGPALKAAPDDGYAHASDWAVGRQERGW